jgi:CheY-like chemotaxis protein
VILRVLAQRGYEVIEAGNMAEALGCWHQRTAGAPIDLLITDLMMPGGTGHELADALWQLAPQLPVLFMSGYDEDVASTERGRQVVHLLKPFRTTQLLDHVESLLRAASPSPDPGGH